MRAGRYTERQKLYFIIFITGFLFKYNYLLLEVFQIPSFVGIVLRNIVFILFSIYFLLPFIRKKSGRITSLIFLSLFTVIFISNYWYAGYFGNYLSVRDMGKGGNLIPVLEMVYYQIFQLKDLLFFLDIAVLFFLVKDRDQGFYFNYREKKKKIIPVLIIIILLFSQIFICNYLLGGYDPYRLYQMDSGGFVNVYGLAPLYFYEIYLEKASRESGQVDEEMDSPSLLEEEEMKGDEVGKDLNIIAVQVESLDEKIIGHKHNGREITPFLNSLGEKGLSAEYFFAQHVNGSFDADFSFLTSLYPVNKSYAFNENDMTAFNSLVRILKEEGYSTAAFHGNRKTFFHRDKAFPDLGFDWFYGLSDYNQKNREIEIMDEGLGINDYDFFTQTFEHIKKMKTPFFSYLITLTSHGPFKYYPPEYSKKFSEMDSRLVIDYFSSMSFVDSAIKMFYQKLEKAGLLDDSLIVIYGDHEAGIKRKEYNSSNNYVPGKDRKPLEQVPLIIIHPEINQGTIEKVGSITDLAPTILDLIGIEKKPEDFAGMSLLDEQDKPVLFFHEPPLFIHKGQLYEQQREDFINIGSFGKGDREQVELSENTEEEVMELINYLYNIMESRKKNNM